MGSYLKGESPLQKMKLSGPPKADVLVFNTNQCRDVKDWFQFYRAGVEHSLPGNSYAAGVDDVDAPLVSHVAGQIEGLVEPLEKVAGRRLDIDRLREVIGLSRETTMLWKAVLESAANVPAPLSFFDGTIQMAPAVVMGGLPEAVDYYRILLAELQERVAAGVAAVAGEKFRIYWEGMPIWGKLSTLARSSCNCGCAWSPRPIAIVGSSRTWIRRVRSRAWLGRTAASSSAVRKTTKRPTFSGWWRGSRPMASCITTARPAPTIPTIVTACRSGCRVRHKPYLVVNGDLNDLRLYSEEQTRTSIEAFVEQMGQG